MGLPFEWSRSALAAKVDWSDVPSWVSAVSALFALVFAAAALVVSRRNFLIESARDRVDEAARREQESFARRAQAARVSAWWETDRTGRVGVFVRNASNAPVYQAHLTVLSLDGRSPTAKIHNQVLPPGDEARFFPVPAGAGDSLRVQLCFTDAAGVRWMRSPYGRLTELGSTLRIKTDQMRADTFTQFGEDFLATYGVTVTYEVNPDRITQVDFTEDVAVPDATDALIAPHDWIGDLQRKGIIEPTVLPVHCRQAFLPWALDALTLNGRLYGIPMTVDTVALIRNIELAPEAPSTFDELIEIGEGLHRAGLVTEVFSVRVGEQGDPFQIWPMFASAGGRLFGRSPSGEWDPHRVELATAESVAAFDRIRSLGEAGAGIIRRSTGFREAFGAFASRRTAFLITTSDGMLHTRNAGTPFAVSAVPPFADGGPATAFTLVHGLLMARQGVNKVTAHDLFADYLTQPRVAEALLRNIVSPVAIKARISLQDPGIEQYQKICDAGLPMPLFPQMEPIWRILGRAQAAVISGAPSAPVAEAAAAQISRLFAVGPA
jgi:maltose-binding protein MalE